MTNQASENLSKENILWSSVFWRKLHNCIQVIRRIGKWNTLMSSFSKLSLESHWIFLQLSLESLKTKMTNLLILCALCVVIYDVSYDCYFTIDYSIRPARPGFDSWMWLLIHQWLFRLPELFGRKRLRVILTNFPLRSEEKVNNNFKNQNHFFIATVFVQ